MDQSSTASSSPSSTPASSPPAKAHNPYQRIASRRAIACVTCAKAKTKCDKGLPHCSRCITKGIKCEPRSTRRTSDNSYRPSLRKTFVTPKRYHSTSAISSLNRHNSPRSLPSARHRPMRAASHIDFRTAVKMSQQASTLSGFPMLTPLPTFNTQVLDECRRDVEMPNPNLVDFSSTPEVNSFPMSGPLTPQTPESIIYQEPLSMTHLTEHWMDTSSWSDDTIAAIGLGCETDLSGMIPTDVWPSTELVQSTSITQMPWLQSHMSVSPQSMSSEFLPHSQAVPPLSINDYSVDEYKSHATFQDDWINCQITSSELNMANLVTAAPFVPDLRSFASTAPVWEDVFIPGPAPY